MPRRRPLNPPGRGGYRFGAGRPRTALTLSLTPEQYATVAIAALATDTDLSAFATEAVLDAADKQAEKHGFPRIVRETT